ncbi:endo alpha-1,4 polygalactosaminidase [Sphingomonas sp.]|uniref:endo alpha-1,4 polygalactosaminidase n=1 Tax=Sphingomonas sp. TaxID=28214 RepID=UPI0035AFD9AF
MTHTPHLDRRGILAASAFGLTLGLRQPVAARGALFPEDDWQWALDYGPATDPTLARQYRLLVLEPHHPRPIAPLRGPASRLLGYVSLGEVEHSRDYAAMLDKVGALGPPNPNWPDARMLDLRHAAARRVVIERIVPDVLALGYDGIFIDTMDSIEAMERQDPVRNKGMVAAGAAMIAALRARFPAMRIMLNRGYAMLPEVATKVDIVLGEAMASRWNFTTKRYELLSDSDWSWQAERLRAARASNPDLVLATLDYWDPAAEAQVAKLYARERAAGFQPYVATLALDRLIPEPTG